jgi:hypothetical protein
MIHYHGTPITPRSKLLEMSGRHFCVSYAEPRDLSTVLTIGQSIMFDNGAFTAYTQGKPMDEIGYRDWVEEYCQHPHWCVIPDVIGGDEETQRKKINEWTFDQDFSAPVWHLGLSLDWLLELADNWSKICFGSSAEYWQVGSPSWTKRMDQAYEMLCTKRTRLPWIHGLRMLGQCGNKWPLASADSTNIGRNHKTLRIHPELMAERIDSVQPSRKWSQNPQIELIYD